MTAKSIAHTSLTPTKQENEMESWGGGGGASRILTYIIGLYEGGKHLGGGGQ